MAHGVDVEAPRGGRLWAIGAWPFYNNINEASQSILPSPPGLLRKNHYGERWSTLSE